MRRIAAAILAATALAGAVLTGSPASADVTIQVTCFRTVRVESSSFGEAGPIDLPSAGSTASSTNCGMAQGAVSSAVLALQRALNHCYGEHLAEDSQFGPLTKAALVRAQQDEGISADGAYGPQTRDHLWFWLGLSTCNPVRLPITLA